MITTTGIAKGKMCPFYNAHQPILVESGGLCVANACEAWCLYVAVPGKGNPKDKAEHGIKRDTDKKGFCGLAERH